MTGNVSVSDSTRPAQVSPWHLVGALVLFSVTLWVGGALVWGEGRSSPATPSVANGAPLSLLVEADGYATLRGISFPLDELPGQLSELKGAGSLPPVQLRVPRDVAAEILLGIMGTLKAGGVPYTSVEVAEPGLP